MISVAPVLDSGGCSCGKFIFTTRFSLKEIGKGSCDTSDNKTMNSNYACT